MNGPKSVLTIAGSDSVGGAGIQADIKTIFSLGLYAASAITAITAQNTCGVRKIQAVDSDVLAAQIDAVLEDLSVAAIKIGMVYTTDNVLAIKQSLQKNNYRGPLVLDPVLVATSGAKLAKEDFLSTFCRELIPLCNLLTPNLSEAEALCGRQISSVSDMADGGKEIIQRFGCRHVLIKGGHSTGNEMTDVLVMENGDIKTFTANKIDSENTHGTGCTLSSAIASFLAMGHPMEESIERGKTYVYQAIAAAKEHKMGHGHGSTNHFHNLQFKQPY